MLINTWLCLLAIVQICFSQASTTRDQDGVPFPNDPVVIQHRKNQEALIAYEKESRDDALFRQSLSQTAIQANEIVSKIRLQEIADVWTVPGTLGNESSERFAGEMFPLARPFIQGTKLFNIIQRMPKGSLLHAHFGALVPYDILLKNLLKAPGMHIFSPLALSNGTNKKLAPLAFAFVRPTTILNATGSIWTEEYSPTTPVPVVLAADSFPDGGRAGFLRYLKSKLTISIEESISHELGVNAIWKTFEATFVIQGTLYAYEPLFRAYLQELFKALVSDGIQWVELRQTFSLSDIVREGQETRESTPDFMLQVIEEETAKFQATELGKSFWGTRGIWSGVRGLPRDAIISDMKNALAMKKKHPNMVAGYDLVAQEDLGRPLSDLAPELIWFDEQRTSHGIEIPYFFHAGETLGDGTTTDNNLFDAVLFQTRRIGHGFSLYKHPELMKEYREKNILVEVCPISNEVLRLATDILHHPLPALVAHGVPTAISNDDPNIEGQDSAGLAFDFYEVIQAFDNIGLAGLGALAQNSVRWSNFEDQNYTSWINDIELGQNGTGIKAQRLQEWNLQWEQFCIWIVKEFGNSTSY